MLFAGWCYWFPKITGRMYSGADALITTPFHAFETLPKGEGSARH